MERKTKVLVVEDDGDVISYLSVWLADQGFDVDVARDGEEAMQRVKAARPDIITLDIIMPRKTGMNFYKEVKKNLEYSSIPVIVITGVQPDFKALLPHRRITPPPDAYISKPFGHDELLSALKKVLGSGSPEGVQPA